MVVKRVTLAVDRDPWDRQSGESLKQYARFTFYRDLGRLRTLAQVHKTLTASGDAIRYGTLRQISYEFRWGSRCESWDVYQDQEEREKLISDRRDMIRRHRSIASALLTKAISALKDMGDKPDMAPADIVRFVKLATDIERIAIGEPQRTFAVTGPSGGPVQTEDLTNLSREERRSRLAEISAELARRAGMEPGEDE